MQNAINAEEIPRRARTYLRRPVAKRPVAMETAIVS
jgi:hypothetical protein